MRDYMLERKEPHIVKTELLKNRTHQSHRWKQVAKSSDLVALKAIAAGRKGYRIIDWNTLKVVYQP